MLTRQGLVAVGAGFAAVVVGRVFGVLELYVIGAAFFAAAAVAIGYVHLRRPRIEAARWIHPSMLAAGDTGRVDIHLHHVGTVRSAPFLLREGVSRSIGDRRVARLPAGPLARDARTSTGYPIPSAVRGVIEVGPLEVELRDPLGIASVTTPIVGIDEIVVAPRAHLLEMPRLGQGALGSALLAAARRLGPGEFHGLREYVDGDEPRSIHWKASARTDDLMVKEHTIEGLQRCTVVFDATVDAHPDAAAFERGVTAAASLVHSSVHAGLATRFVTNDGVDLRGPDVVATALRVLARTTPSRAALSGIGRDTGEGLGLLVVVTGSRRTSGWRAAQSVLDPAVTMIAVLTGDAPAGALDVPARSDDALVRSWQALTGRGRLDLLGA
jgi:uncharacterized protein (DUF58 family)